MAGGEAGNLVEQLCALDLTEEEAKACEPDDEELKNAVMVKVLARRPVSYRPLTSTLGEIWGTSSTMKHRKVGNNMFLLNFSQSCDMEHVLQDGPWSFNDKPLVFVEYDGFQKPSELHFKFLPLWIRFYDLPLSLMNNRSAKTIGSMFGEVLEVDCDGGGSGWGEYLRVRVKIDITKPLRRGVMIKTARSQQSEGDWYSVKYEKLPHFCFCCGLVGDHICECDGGKEASGAKAKYTEELRAPMGRRNFQKNQQWTGGDSGKEERKRDARGAEENARRSATPDIEHTVQDGANTTTTENEASVEKTSEEGRGGGQADLRVVAVVEQAQASGHKGIGEERPGTQDPGTRRKPFKKLRKKGVRVEAGTVAGKISGGLITGEQNSEDVENNRALMEIDTNVTFDRFTQCNKRKRGPFKGSEPLLLEWDAVGTGEGGAGTGPEQKRRKEVDLSELCQFLNTKTAKAAPMQPRRSP